MNKLAFYLSIFFSALLGAKYFAQEIHFNNISNSLNLPSQECYNIIQDSKGFIWICTENGLVKYSKDERVVFDKKNGLDENGVYFIRENKNHEIQLITSNNRILLINNKDQIREHKGSKRLQEILKTGTSTSRFNVSYHLNSKSNGDLVINSQQKTFQISSNTNEIFDLTSSNEFNSDAYIIINKGSNEDYFIKNQHTYDYNTKSKNHIFKIAVFNGKKRKIFTVELKNEFRLDWRIRFSTINGITYLSMHNILIKIDENLNIKTQSFPSVITCIYADSNNGLWVGTASNGVFHFPDISKMNKFNRGLLGLTVSSILVDKEGGTWCTTTEKGVYYSSNYNILYYPQYSYLNKKTTLFKVAKNKLFVSAEIDKLYVLDKNGINQIPVKTTGNTDITDVIHFDDKLFLGTKVYVGLLDEHFKFNKMIIQNKTRQLYKDDNISVYQFDTISSNLYALGIGLIFKYEGTTFKQIGGPLSTRGTTFKIINDSIAFYGSNEGLFEVNFNNSHEKKFQIINTAVSKIIKSRGGIIYIATKGQGLFKLVNGALINIPLGKNNYILNDIIEDEKGHFWISTVDGLLEFYNVKTKYFVQKYNTSNGLISNNIGQLTIDGTYLYVSSPDGICKFPVTTNLLNTVPPTLSVKLIKVNDTPIQYNGQSLKFDYFENSFTVLLDQFTFRTGNNESIYYKLIGLNDDFKTSKLSELKFENLPPNNYELLIYSVNNDGLKSAHPIRLKFIISPPFWQTGTFIFGLAILFLCACYLAFRIIIKNIRKKEEEKTRINKLISEYQLSALQAQMNPHFIFNAINSIQNYILNKKEDEAYNYLAKFSKLIRMVLNNSREKELNLSTELETLNLYIELEQLRFDNSFEFRLNISDEINLYDIEIPDMLIQPYIENAIWHGLMNLNGERKGVLKLDIRIEDDLLKIIIEDNGVGRNRSNEYKSDQLYDSIAMKLTEERLEMINRMGNSKNVKAIITDVYNNNQVQGTKVELYLPLIH